MHVPALSREASSDDDYYSSRDSELRSYYAAIRHRARRRARAGVVAASALLLPLLGVTGVAFGMPAMPQESLAVASGDMHELPLPHRFQILNPNSYEATTQREVDWCMPASAETSLQTVLGVRIDQQVLAGKMHTDAYGLPGTLADNARYTLNGYVQPDNYEYVTQVEMTPTDLADDLYYDIVTLKAAPIAVEAPHEISYVQNTNTGGHAVDVVGVDTISQNPAGWQVEILDPEPVSAGGGYHWMSVSQLDQNMTPQGRTGAVVIGIIRQ